MLFRLTPRERRALCVLLFALSFVFLALGFLFPPGAHAADVPESENMDVVILYTPAAHAIQGSDDGFRAAINGMFAAANQAYAASSISARLRLAGAKATSHVEGALYEDDLYELTGVEFDEKGDGWTIDDPSRQPALCREGMAFREERGADLVCLLRQGADSLNTAGLAWVNSSYFDGDDASEHEFERLAYCVVGMDFIGIHSFPHEIGHNLGCAHDRHTDNAASPSTKNKIAGHFPYSYGYKPSSSTNEWGTIMSYTNNRILLYSSPELRHNGQPAGVAQGDNYSADNVSTLRHTIPHAATFRSLPKSTIAFSPLPGAAPGNGTVSVTLSTTRPGSTIRYTLDGANVTETSPAYTGPLAVPRGTPLAARVYRGEDNTPAECPTAATYAPEGSPGEVAAPVFNLPGGTYDNSASLTFAAPPSGVTIRYTLDGSEPTETAAAYINPVQILRDTTVRARAFSAGMTPSSTATAVYVIRLSPPAFNPGDGTSFGRSLGVALSAAPETTIFYTTDGSSPGISISEATKLYSGPITLTRTTTLQALAFRNGCAPSSTARATYTQEIGMSDMPVFTHPSGTYENEATLAFDTPSTAGTTIRYTLDGSEPTEASTACTSPVQILRDTTVRARAFSPGLAPSSVTTAVYTIRLTPPEITPPGGTYTGYVHVTLTAAPQTTIQYAFSNNYSTGGDFHVNTLSGTYTGPLQFTNSGRLVARACRDGCAPSEEVSATYSLSAAPSTAAPVLTPPPCDEHGNAISYDTEISVVITSPTPGAEIRYTLDGTTPSPGSQLYTTPLLLTEDTVVRARAYHPSYSPGPETRAEYRVWTNSGPRPPDPAGEVSYTTNSPYPKPARPGEYHAVLYITPSCKTPGAIVRHTLDGSEVTENSPAASSAIVLDRIAVHTAPGSAAAEAAPPQNVTVRLRAYAPDCLPGAETIATFTDVTSAPWFLYTPVSRTKDPGEANTFTVVVRAAPAPSFQWYKDGEAIAGAIRSSYSIAHVKKTDAGNYHVVVTNLAGSVASKPAQLSLRVNEETDGNSNEGTDENGNPGEETSNNNEGGGTSTAENPAPPTISRFYATFDAKGTGEWKTDSDNASVAATLARLRGEFSEFIAIAPGKAPTLRIECLSNSASTSFDWLLNGVSIATTRHAANSPITNDRSPLSTEFTPDPSLLGDGNVLQVRVSNPAGTATSRPVHLAIVRAPEIHLRGPSTPLRTGQTLRLEAGSKTDPRAPFLRYTWTKDGEPLPNAVLPVFTRTAATTADSGHYTVTATASCGQTATASIDIVVEP
ncbi:MAG: chitobiase/beta-hexosaminidase C-terminal domain-containing protein [Puniceicoccales bacterium]|nr:chitobiase/beta-hexosaminidase C-terminal domain-containing protein [Puniceicoccales bacterium]